MLHRDVHWQLLGHALDREDAVEVVGVGEAVVATGCGVFPTFAVLDPVRLDPHVQGCVGTVAAARETISP